MAKKEKISMAEIASDPTKMFEKTFEQMARMIGSTDDTRTLEDGAMAYWTRNAIGENPSSYLMNYTPTQSLSSAYGMWFINSPQFYDACDEIEGMSLTVKGCFKHVSDNVQARPHAYIVDDEEDESQHELRNFIKDVVDPLLYNMIEILIKHCLGPGISPMELIWSKSTKHPGKWVISEVLHRHPGHFCFDDKRRLRYFQPGSYLDSPLVPPGKYAISRISAKYANPYGDSTTMAIAPYFWIQKQMLLGAVDYSARYGVPIPVMTVGNGAGVDDSNTANADYNVLMRKIKTALADMRKGAGLIIPQGIDFQMVDGASGQFSGPYMDWFKLIDDLIMAFILGSTLGVKNAEHGSRAQAEVHESTSDMRVRPMGKLASDIINEQVIDPLLVINFGPEAKGLVKIEIDMEDSENQEDTIKSLEALGNLGVPVSLTEVYERLGWRKPDDGDETVTAKPPMPPAGPGGSFSTSMFPGADLTGGHGSPPASPIDGEKKNPETDGAADIVEASEEAGLEVDPPSEPPPLQSEAAKTMEPIALEFVRIHTKVGEVAASLEKDQMQRAIRDYIKADAQGLVDFKPDKESDLALGAGLLLSGFEAGQEIKAHDETTGNAVFASKFSEEKTDVEAAYDDYHRAVNMTASELESWAESEASKKASLDRSPITRNLRLLRKPKAEWTARDAAAARKTTAFIARMRKVKAGDDVGDTGMSKRTISLKNWAFDPNKSSMSDDEGGDILKFNQSTALIFPADFPDAFQKSAQWMIDRGILTRAQVLAWAAESADVWAALAETYGGTDGLQKLFENSIRERTLALKDAVDTTLTRKIQEELAINIDAGQTRTAFLEALDKRVEAGDVPGGDAYLNTVYRTEVANAYERQSVEIETIPEVDEYLWGWLIMTAEDNQVRPGHAALQGLYFKKSGQAAELLGRPPWSYNCRCIMVRQIQSVPGSAGENEYQESDGALAAAAGVERF